MGSRPGRRVPGLLAVLTFAVAAVAGCGVPGSGRPVVVGPANRAATTGESGPQRPHGPGDATRVTELVDYFLQSSAGANRRLADPQAYQEAVANVRQFFADDSRNTWQPGTDKVTVVRYHTDIPVSGDSGVQRVTVRVEPVGVLNDRGQVTSAPDLQGYSLVVEVVSVGGGWRIAHPPQLPGLLLSTDGLEQGYSRRYVYFWDTTGRQLVPDLRYLPKSLAPSRVPGEIFSWLRAGPVDWLALAAHGLSESFELRDQPVIDNQHASAPLVVNLSAKAAGTSTEEKQALTNQLRWSLMPDRRAVQLQVEGQPQNQVDGASSKFLYANAAVPQAAGKPEAYCVVRGVVRPVAATADGPPVALRSAQNRDVVSAAVANNGSAGALVRTEGPRRRLWLGRRAGNDDTTAYQPTDLIGGTIGQPIWLAAPSQAVLVVSDGRLYHVSLAEKIARDITPLGNQAVTAAALAPDGRRLALIADGRVSMASLEFDNEAVSVGAAGAPLGVDGLTGPTSLSWQAEGELVIAGSANGNTVLAVGVTIDGVRGSVETREGLGGQPVTGLATYPRNPIDDSGSGAQLLVEWNRRAYQVFGASISELVPTDAGVAPSPSGSPQPVDSGGTPSAPFYRMP
jgi:hypothetical protein